MKSHEPIRKEQDRREVQLVNLLHKICLVLGRRAHFSPSSRIWTCRFRRVRKLPNEL